MISLVLVFRHEDELAYSVSHIQEDQTAYNVRVLLVGQPRGFNHFEKTIHHKEIIKHFQADKEVFTEDIKRNSMVLG